MQSSLSILVDEKRVEDLLRQQGGAKALLKSWCNLCAFIGFIVLFTVMALFEPLPLYRSYEAYLRHRFDNGAAMRLEEVNSASDFYFYMERSLIPGIYSNDTTQYTGAGMSMPTMLKVDGDKANTRLFGLLRIRQLRSKPLKQCSLQDVFKPYFTECYAKFETENQFKGSFGPSDELGTAAKYEWSPDPKGDPYSGWLATYPPGGYMQKLHVNYTAAIELVKKMRSDLWVGPATRALFFEFTLYNFNLGLYAVCRIAFEISPAGTWLKTFDVDIIGQRFLKPLGNGGAGSWGYLIMEVVLVVFVMRYILEEMSEFIGFDNGHSKNPCRRMRIKYDYFYDGWNILDWLNLILIIVVLGYRVSNWGVGGEVIKSMESVVGTDIAVANYRSFHAVVNNVRIIRELTAFNAVLIWFKAVKYINILPYISTFIETMAIAWKLLAGWIAVFGTCFIGFCLSYSTAFGDSISDFRTVPRAFVFLIRTFVGDADMRLVYDANPVIGSMLIVLFVVGMIFVNMNLFYAILISSLSQARQSQEVIQAKKTQKLLDKFYGFADTAARVLQLQQRFRQCFPGLYSRMRNWEKQRLELERKRDDRIAEKTQKKNPDGDVEETLGAASPNFGRRAQRKKAQAIEDEDALEEESEIESEPDLGSLYFKDQLNPHRFHEAHHHDHDHHDGSIPHPFGEPVDPAELEREKEEHAKAMILEATEYVCDTVKERCRGARQIVLAEMNDAREVFQGIASVVEVLRNRAKSLEAQQETVLPAEVLARVKEAGEIDD
jgi:hypothetical protein